MPYTVDFASVSAIGLESSPAAFAGLRANEARYFKNKYDHVFTASAIGASGLAYEVGHVLDSVTR